MDIYGNIYHQYTPNVSIYTIHGSYGFHPIHSVQATRRTLAAATVSAVSCGIVFRCMSWPWNIPATGSARGWPQGPASWRTPSVPCTSPRRVAWRMIKKMEKKVGFHWLIITWTEKHMEMYSNCSWDQLFMGKRIINQWMVYPIQSFPKKSHGELCELRTEFPDSMIVQDLWSSGGVFENPNRGVSYILLVLQVWQWGWTWDIQYHLEWVQLQKLNGEMDDWPTEGMGSILIWRGWLGMRLDI